MQGQRVSRDKTKDYHDRGESTAEINLLDALFIFSYVYCIKGGTGGN